MNAPCREFRMRLEQALLGRPMPAELGSLAWHEHLAACDACRGLLESEQVLEELLATLPEPRLDPDLARRVLDRLHAAAEPPAELDALLDLAVEGPAPEALPERILGGLRPARADLKLDSLLDRVPEPEVPAELAANTLGALAVHRAGRRPAAILPETDDRLRRFSVARPVWLAAAAALLLAVIAGRILLWKEPLVPALPLAGTEKILADPDEELLAVLDVLEAWDVLVEDDLDLFLGSLSTSDEFLLDWDTDAFDTGIDSYEDGETSELEEG